MRQGDDRYADGSINSRNHFMKIGMTIFFEADRSIWKEVHTQKQGKEKRKDLGLTWHHVERKSGQKATVQLVPTKLHDAVKHTGGVATQESTKLKTKGK